MLDSHHILLGKLQTAIFLCSLGLEGKIKQSDGRNQVKRKLLICSSLGFTTAKVKVHCGKERYD